MKRSLMVTRILLFFNGRVFVLERGVKNKLYIAILFVLFSGTCIAQAPSDTVKFADEAVDDLPKEIESKHSPGLATLMSAAIPGAGQVYNKKIWKVPIIYAGFVALAYGTSYYGELYHNFRSVYEDALANEDATSFDKYTVAHKYGYSITDLKNYRDLYRKHRDLCYIGGALWYCLILIDANVDAHFFDFDVGDDLTLMINQPMKPEAPLSFAVSLRF